MTFRLACGIVVLLCFIAPVTAAWLVLTAAAGALPGFDVWNTWKTPLEEPASSVKTPNPSKAPGYFLKPLEALVYYHPAFAGTIIFWLVPWAVILIGFTVLTMVFVRRRRARGHRLPRGQRLSSYVAGSLLLGVLFATPWFYALWLAASGHADPPPVFSPYEPWDSKRVLPVR